MNRIFFFICIITAFISHNVAYSQEYKVGANIDNAPFSFINEKGEMEGLDIDICKAISEDTNIDFTYKLDTWANTLEAIKNGNIDIVTTVVFSKHREEYLDFTIPLHIDNYNIFIRKDLPLDGIPSLQEYKPCIIAGDYINEGFLQSLGLYKIPVEVLTISDAFIAIESGVVDYVIYPNIAGYNEINEHNYKNITVKGPIVRPNSYCLAVKKGNTELLNKLNRSIMNLKKSGKLGRIQSKWDINKKNDSPLRVLVLIGIIILILLIITVSWVFLLKRQVRKKTQYINSKNAALEKSDAKYRLITENINDVIWHLDLDFIVSYVSSADEATRGFKKSEVIGQSIKDMFVSEGVEYFNKIKALWGTPKQNNKITSIPIEFEVICKNGDWKWFEHKVSPLFNTEGLFIGYSGISRDISKRKVFENKLKSSEAKLKELNSTKDRLFSIIAHDLRGPVGNFKHLVEFLLESIDLSDTNMVRSLLESVQKETTKTFDLLENLLEWSRSQQNTISFSPSIINTKATADNVLSLLTRTAESKGITIHNNINEDVTIFADKNMLMTIIRNLASNAIKFTTKDHSIYITATTNSKETTISVHDEGVGIKKENISKIFQSKEHYTTYGTDNEKGTGLGLSLCLDFVQKHNGKIWVESDEEKGSTFSFTIPFNN